MVLTFDGSIMGGVFMKPEEVGFARFRQESKTSPDRTDPAVETLDGKLKNLRFSEIHETENVEKIEGLKEENNVEESHYPLRPGEPDCSFYLRNGTCRYGLNCRFNHPPRKRNQDGTQKDKAEEEYLERAGQPECKFYLTTGGCKYGKACKFNHAREKAGVEEAELELNFLGLPIRPGEKECYYYMRTGSCKFATNCIFHHPDPTAVGGDPISGYNNSGSIPLHSPGAAQQPLASWPSQRTSSEGVPFMDASASYVPMMFPPQGVHPNLEWNGYQAPVSPLYPMEGNIPPHQGTYPDISTRQRQMAFEEFPERPGEPECSYFMKNGDCKYRSACRYHHPKTRASKSPVCVLSPMGLPLRPDQTICIHYSRYGICKYGPACKFDHPINYGSSTP